MFIVVPLAAQYRLEGDYATRVPKTDEVSFFRRFEELRRPWKCDRALAALGCPQSLRPKCLALPTNHWRCRAKTSTSRTVVFSAHHYAVLGVFHALPPTC